MQEWGIQHRITKQYMNMAFNTGLQNSIGNGHATQDYRTVQERGCNTELQRSTGKEQATQDYKTVQERGGNTRLQDSIGKGR